MRILTVLLSIVVGVSAQQLECPKPPIDVRPVVTPSVTFDAGSGLYTYSYSVRNEDGSPLDIEAFSVATTGIIRRIAKPQGWIGMKLRKYDIVQWYAADAEELKPGEVDDGNIKPAISRIRAGQQLAGFSFQSPNGPGPVKFYAQGFDPIPTASSEDEAEVMLAQCAGTPEHPIDNQEDRSLIGTTVGPVDAIPVTIDIKPDDTNNVINPRNQGVIPVAVLSTASFDATTIDATSLRLGPGQAHPKDDRGHIEDVNNDGKPDLLLQFPTQQIGARCNDTALMLTGATRTGTKVQGSDHIQTAGCKR